MTYLKYTFSQKKALKNKKLYFSLLEIKKLKYIYDCIKDVKKLKEMILSKEQLLCFNYENRPNFTVENEEHIVKYFIKRIRDKN